MSIAERATQRLTSGRALQSAAVYLALLTAVLALGTAIDSSSVAAAPQQEGVLQPGGSPADSSAAGDVASDSFGIEGTVKNGTAGGAVPSGEQIRVIAFTNEGIVKNWEATIADDGSYRIDNIDRVDGATYAIGLDYAQATYLDRVMPGAAGATVSQDLTVYESSATDPGIRFEQSAVVFSGVDEAQRMLTVLEIHAINNPTDRAFTPRSDGPGGPAGLLVFPLPPNATEVTPEIGLDPQMLVQIDRGFASFNPILPGRVEVVFHYRLPYTQESFDFTRTARYPIASFQVLSPADGPRVESAQLSSAEGAAVGSRQYKRLSGGPLAPGESVAFSMNGLPIPGGPLARIPPGALVVGGTLLALLAVVGAWARDRGEKDARGADLEPDDLVEQIVALDLAFADGRIGAAEHEAARTSLIQLAVQRATAVERTPANGREGLAEEAVEPPEAVAVPAFPNGGPQGGQSSL